MIPCAKSPRSMLAWVTWATFTKRYLQSFFLIKGVKTQKRSFSFYDLGKGIGFTHATLQLSKVMQRYITQKTHQRWTNVETTLIKTFVNVVSMLIFGWKCKLSRRTFIDVVSTLAKQRWNNVDRILLIQRRWTNVVATLKFGWKWKLSRRMFIRDNVERITSIQCQWPNVVSMLIFDWKEKLSQHIFIAVEKTALKQLCQYLLYWCSLESGSITKQS